MLTAANNRLLLILARRHRDELAEALRLTRATFGVLHPQTAEIRRHLEAACKVIQALEGERESAAA